MLLAKPSFWNSKTVQAWLGVSSAARSSAVSGRVVLLLPA
jgi:hypothetical protein